MTHDLDRYLSQVVARSFRDFRPADFEIRWMRAGKPGRKKVVHNPKFTDQEREAAEKVPDELWVSAPRITTMAQCFRSEWLIEVNEALDWPWVPPWVFRALIFHELLHIFVGAAHDKAFKIAEHTRHEEWKALELWWVRSRYDLYASVAVHCA